MSITDELREFIDSLACHKDTRDMMRRIADRIDERHERALADAELCAAPTEAQLSELGYVKLPVDADGVPIHVGDVMDVGIVFAIGDEGVFMVENGFSGKYAVECFDGFACYHVKPDSWERIIHDAFVESQEHFGSADAVAELVERCKRLAGERA